MSGACWCGRCSGCNAAREAGEQYDADEEAREQAEREAEPKDDPRDDEAYFNGKDGWRNDHP